MATRGAARINLIADATGVRRGTREAERDISRLSRAGTASFSALKTGALAAGAAIGTTLAVGVRTGWQELQEAEAASARLNTVLAATKGAAGLTRAELDRMNETLQRNSTLEGDVIQGAQALLLTYTNIGEKTFPRATQAAIDWARVMKVDAESAAKLVGRALQDPEKGLARLERAGLSFTAAERKRIQAMQEAGRETEAQNLILQKLEGRVRGAEQAYGQTLPGAIDKAKRAYKDFTEDAVRRAIEYWPRIREVIGRVVDWLRVNVVPDVRAAVQAITEFWEKHQDDIRAIVAVIGRTLHRLWDQVKDVIRLVKAVLEGDFGEAWEAAKRIVRRAVEGVGDLLRTLGPIALRSLRTLGANILRGLGDAIRSLPETLGEAMKAIFRALPGLVRDAAVAAGRSVGQAFASAVTDAAPSWLNPGRAIRRRAGGGFLPGEYRGVDDQVIFAASGEAVLTPAQQAMIPGGVATLRRIFQLTGGVAGGGSFRTGGVVDAARQRAEGNLGEPYGRPSRGQSRTGPGSWDCSGYATMIAGVNVGGTTASAYQQSVGVRDHSGYPIVWGFRKSHSGSYRGGYDEHMGVRVGGVWYQTSGGVTAKTGSDGSWQEIRVPRGLERLRGTSADGDGSEATTDRSTQPAGLTAQQFRRALRGLNTSPTSPRGLTDVPSIEARHNDDQLQERATMRRAGLRSEVIRGQIAEYRQDVKDIGKRMKQLVGRRNSLTRTINKLRAEGPRRGTSRARRERILEQLRDLYDERRDVQDALRTLAGERDEVARQAAILGYDLTDAVVEEAEAEKAAFEAANPPADAAAAASTEAGGLSPEQERAVRRGEVASNENVLLREFIGAAFGPGDIGQGGVGAVGAATGGRWVPIHVDAGSLSAAVGSSIGTGGYVSASFVPSGA